MDVYVNKVHQSYKQSHHNQSFLYWTLKWWSNVQKYKINYLQQHSFKLQNKPSSTFFNIYWQLYNKLMYVFRYLKPVSTSSYPYEEEKSKKLFKSYQFIWSRVILVYSNFVWGRSRCTWLWKLKNFFTWNADYRIIFCESAVKSKVLTELWLTIIARITFAV